VSQTAARGFRLWTALLAMSLLAATAVAAELHGARAAIWCGAGGGALIVILGHLFNRRATESQPGAFDRNEEVRRWRAWGLGLLVRFLLIPVLAGAFWLACRAHFAAAMFSLLAAYLTLHFWEIAWLCRRSAAAERASVRG
jgi:hypothetical protein